jgi:hypothetical protein
VSCRVVSCRVVSCRVVSCRVVSCRVVSCRVVSNLGISAQRRRHCKQPAIPYTRRTHGDYESESESIRWENGFSCFGCSKVQRQGSQTGTERDNNREQWSHGHSNIRSLRTSGAALGASITRGAASGSLHTHRATRRRRHNDREWQQQHEQHMTSHNATPTATAAGACDGSMHQDTGHLHALQAQAQRQRHRHAPLLVPRTALGRRAASTTCTTRAQVGLWDGE